VLSQNPKRLQGFAPRQVEMMTNSETENLTRPSLLLRIRNSQDVEAWKAFVTIYAPLIVGYCRSRGLQAADAEDVTQEVFSKISRSIGGFRYEPERGRFRDWLGTVAHSELCRCMNRVNRAGRGAGGDEEHASLKELPSETPSTDWSDQFQAHVLATALEQIRQQFEPQTWQAFELVWVQRQPSSAVAKEMGIPLETVYVAKSRVLKRLREKVLELAEEIPTLISRN
jgi:RNA polymerase sigma factor (sigma-70 family)